MKNFKNVLSSLSDTELIVISQEMANPDIPNSSIINQLVAKSNDVDKDYTSIPDIDIMFCIDLCVELGNRLLESDSKVPVDFFI